MIATLGVLLMQLGGVAGSVWVEQPIGSQSDFRSVQALNTQVAWASGNHGTVARTMDGGKTWHAQFVSAAFACDFRISALDSENALLVSASYPPRIYRTTNGGRVWKLQYENLNSGVHLNAGAFFSKSSAMVWGDPYDGAFLILTTTDGGGVWKETPRASIPPPLKGEKGMPAAGSLTAKGSKNAWFGTGGGAVGRIFRTTNAGASWAVSPARLAAGLESGVFALDFRDAMHGVAVGTERSNVPVRSSVVIRSNDGGESWTPVSREGIDGVAESVVFVPRTSPPAIVTVGRGDSRLSTDGGVTFRPFGVKGYASVSFAGPIDAGWVVGPEGRIAKYVSGVAKEKRAMREEAPRPMGAPATSHALGQAIPGPDAPAEGATSPRLVKGTPPAGKPKSGKVQFTN